MDHYCHCQLIWLGNGTAHCELSYCKAVHTAACISEIVTSIILHCVVLRHPQQTNYTARTKCAHKLEAWSTCQSSCSSYVALLAALTCVIAERHGVAFFGATSICHSKHCKVDRCPRRLVGHGETGIHNSSFIISIAVTNHALYSVHDSPIWCFRWQPIQLHYVHTLHKSEPARRSRSYRISIIVT